VERRCSIARPLVGHGDAIPPGDGHVRFCGWGASIRRGEAGREDDQIYGVRLAGHDDGVRRDALQALAGRVQQRHVISVEGREEFVVEARLFTLVGKPGLELLGHVGIVDLLLHAIPDAVHAREVDGVQRLQVRRQLFHRQRPDEIARHGSQSGRVGELVIHQADRRSLGMAILGREVQLDGGYVVDASPEKREFGVEWFSAMQKVLDEGKLMWHPVKVLPGCWEAILEGLKMLKNKEVSGEKLVVRIE
jgi:hypothetical protein